MAFSDNFDSTHIYGIESITPEIGTRLGINTILNGKYGIQSGIAEIGAFLGVNGGFSPNAVLPGCGLDFWTSKQAFYHSYVWDADAGEWKDRVIDSAIYLLKLGINNIVKDSVDLEPVIRDIIFNYGAPVVASYGNAESNYIIPASRGDINERNINAITWINPYYYDRYKNYEPLTTQASPNYEDIPTSDETHWVSYIGGDRDDASSYIRPASYSGILGPVYAGVASPYDICGVEAPNVPVGYGYSVASLMSSGWFPWKGQNGPSDPANIAVRDIKLDALGNLWCLLQIGWQYSPVVANEVRNTSYMGYEARIAVQYDYTYLYGSTADPTSYPIYDPNYFPRQYQPPHGGTYTEQVDRMYRCGLPRARMFLVCFNKSTKFKTWDYIPFIPGTVGFRGKYYIESNLRGPCVQTIATPPMKLDVDEYGNVYAVCGTWFGLDRYNSYTRPHWEGLSYAFNEYLYFYQRTSAEMPVGYTAVASGIDVGRIGPHIPGGYGDCVIWRYDLECTAYKGKTTGSNKTCRKSPWTYTIGGDRALITASGESVSLKTKYYWFSALGNRTLSKCSIKIDYSKKRPIPVFCGKSTSTTAQFPYNIRSWRSEWYNTSGSNSGRELAMEMDLLFAQCDLFTRNYYGTAGTRNITPASWDMYAFNPASWWEYEEPWRNSNLNTPSQIHLDRTGFFQVGSAVGDNPNGFNIAEAPTMFYPHLFNVGDSVYEMQSMGRSGCGAVYTQRIPLYDGSDGDDAGWDQIIRPASTPYKNTATHLTNPAFNSFIKDVLNAHPPASPSMPSTYLVSSYLTDTNSLQGYFVGHEGQLATCTWTYPQTYPNVNWAFANPASGTVLNKSNTDEFYQCILTSPQFRWERKSYYFEKCSISGCLPIMKPRGANESPVIVPFYNFKYEMFTFSGVTWDSFAALRSRYPQTKSAIWPYRWHSMKKFIATASDGGIYAPYYGQKSSYIDPSYVASPGDYTPAKGEKVVRYTAGFVSAVATVKAAADGGDVGAQQAYDEFMQYLAWVKFYIYDTLMRDINFGSFGSSIYCSDKVGMLTPMPLLHATQYYDDPNRTWHLDLVWDPNWGKRLYVISAETKKFDCIWKQQSSTTKKWWAKITDWVSQYIHVNQPVNAVSWYDLSNDHVQTLKKWVMDENYGQYCQEKWQQLCFVNGYPDGTREAPQTGIL